jgi:hypothetical protein
MVTRTAAERLERVQETVEEVTPGTEEAIVVRRY